MKIYTEVNWRYDEKLKRYIETSSDFHNYEGPLALAGDQDDWISQDPANYECKQIVYGYGEICSSGWYYPSECVDTGIVTDDGDGQCQGPWNYGHPCWLSMNKDESSVPESPYRWYLWNPACFKECDSNNEGGAADCFVDFDVGTGEDEGMEPGMRCVDLGYSFTCPDGLCTNDPYTDCAEWLTGCAEHDACNYDSNVIINDRSSCNYNEGPNCACTDPTACNYLAGALVDDGSCNYLENGGSGPNCGCTDSEAINYLAGALVDDGTCIFGGCSRIEGPNGMVSCNYDERVTGDDDDGTCHGRLIIDNNLGAYYEWSDEYGDTYFDPYRANFTYSNASLVSWGAIEQFYTAPNGKTYDFVDGDDGEGIITCECDELGDTISSDYYVVQPAWPNDKVYPSTPLGSQHYFGPWVCKNDDKPTPPEFLYPDIPEEDAAETSNQTYIELPLYCNFPSSIHSSLLVDKYVTVETDNNSKLSELNSALISNMVSEFDLKSMGNSGGRYSIKASENSIGNKLIGNTTYQAYAKLILDARLLTETDSNYFSFIYTCNYDHAGIGGGENKTYSEEYESPIAGNYNIGSMDATRTRVLINYPDMEAYEFGITGVTITPTLDGKWDPEQGIDYYTNQDESVCVKMQAKIDHEFDDYGYPVGEYFDLPDDFINCGTDLINETDLYYYMQLDPPDSWIQEPPADVNGFAAFFYDYGNTDSNPENHKLKLYGDKAFSSNEQTFISNNCGSGNTDCYIYIYDKTTDPDLNDNYEIEMPNLPDGYYKVAEASVGNTWFIAKIEVPNYVSNCPSLLEECEGNYLKCPNEFNCQKYENGASNWADWGSGIYAFLGTTGDFEEYPDTYFLPFNEIKAKCTGDLDELVAYRKPPATQIRKDLDTIYNTGINACKSLHGSFNYREFLEIDNDKRPLLGVFHIKEENQNMGNIPVQIAKQYGNFNQIDKDNLVVNGTFAQVKLFSAIGDFTEDMSPRNRDGYWYNNTGTTECTWLDSGSVEVTTDITTQIPHANYPDWPYFAPEFKRRGVCIDINDDNAMYADQFPGGWNPEAGTDVQSDGNDYVKSSPDHSHWEYNAGGAASCATVDTGEEGSWSSMGWIEDLEWGPLPSKTNSETDQMNTRWAKAYIPQHWRYVDQYGYTGRPGDYFGQRCGQPNALDDFTNDWNPDQTGWWTEFDHQENDPELQLQRARYMLNNYLSDKPAEQRILTTGFYGYGPANIAPWITDIGEWAMTIQSNECLSEGRCLQMSASLGYWENLPEEYSDFPLGATNEPHWTQLIYGHKKQMYQHLNFTTPLTFDEHDGPIKGQNDIYGMHTSMQLSETLRSDRIKSYQNNGTSWDSIMRISFWMKTTAVEDTNNFPMVEAAVVNQPAMQSLISPPNKGDAYDHQSRLDRYLPTRAHHNSLPVRMPFFDNSKDKELNMSRGRFKNSGLGIWEKMEYTIHYSDYSYTSHSNKVMKRWLQIQWASNGILNPRGMFDGVENDLDRAAYGRVLIDNVSIIEGYDFKVDTDVRGKFLNKDGNIRYGKDVLTKYYDPKIQPEEYKDSTAPLEAQFYFYPRYNTNDLFDHSAILYDEFKEGLFYLYDVDWGDGSPPEFVPQPKQIGYDVTVNHTYDDAGIYEITGYMIRNTATDGTLHNKKFSVVINVNEGRGEDFTFHGSENGFNFIPFSNTHPIVGGISDESIYYKTIKRMSGFIGDDIQMKPTFVRKSDQLKSELALIKMKNQISDTQDMDDLDLLPEFLKSRYFPQDSGSWDDSNKIYNGLSPIREELGKSTGDSDYANVRYFNTTMSMWEMLGFEDEEAGIPDNEKYYKNIIPEDYSIFNREGIPGGYNCRQHTTQVDCNSNGNIYGCLWEEGNYEDDTISQEGPCECNNNELGCDSNPFIDTSVNQDWIGTNEYGNTYYYPVLPKYNKYGEFEDSLDTGSKIPFPKEAPVTNEKYINKNLKFNINSETIEDETNVLKDLSGNQNVGHYIGDYKPTYDDETLYVKKTKNKEIVLNPKKNRAF